MVTLWSVVPRFHPNAHEDCISLYNPVARHLFLKLVVVLFSSVAERTSYRTGRFLATATVRPISPCTHSCAGVCLN